MSARTWLGPVLGLGLLGAIIATVWMVVPIETNVTGGYLNVYTLTGMHGKLPAFSFDNMTMPDVEDAGIYNGIYAWQPHFYHASFERFFSEWSDRHHMILWECQFWCQSSREGGRVVIALDERPAQGAWRLLEFYDDDNNGPYQIARTKKTGKKKMGGYKHRTNWVEMNDNPKTVREIEGAGFYSAWDLIISIPFAITFAAAVAGLVYWFYMEDPDA